MWDQARLTAPAKLKQAAPDKIAGVAVTGSRILQLGQFHPIVFSSGGLMEGGTGGTLERIKKKLQPGAYGHFVRWYTCWVPDSEPARGARLRFWLQVALVSKVGRNARLITKDASSW